tara:strand:+ start:120 stop:1175 length:1056 start_codon:yes stop_codon:yes gene_type:complete
MSIKEIYDVSFIKMKGSENIDMQGNNLYQVNKLLFTDNNEFIDYQGFKIFEISNNDVISNIHTVNSDILETNKLKFYSEQLDVLELSINSLTCNNIKTNNLTFTNSSSNSLGFSELTFNNYYGDILDASDVSANTFYSVDLSSNTINTSKSLNIYNNSFTINNDNSFNIISISNDSLITYDGDNKTIILNNVKSSYVKYYVIYGTLRCNTVDNYDAFYANENEQFPEIFFGSMIVNLLSSESDDKLKHNEQLITDGLSVVNRLKPKYYIKTNNYIDIDNSKLSYSSGYIAQDISNDIPELTHVINKSQEYLSVKYTQIQPYITRAIQELDILCEKIKSDTNSLQQQVELLI